MQRRIVLWILGIFCILPFLGIEAIAGLIPIHLYLQKLSRYQQLRTHSLLKNHIIKFLLENRHNELGRNYCLLLENLTSIQQLKVKGPIADSNNRLNKIFPSFNPLSNKISPGSRLIDIFSSHFSFHSSNQKSKDKRSAHIHKLEEYVLQTSANSKIVVVVSDTSIKNHIAISIAHVHSFTNPIIKILHYVINITTTEAKLFAIKCSINQAV